MSAVARRSYMRVERLEYVDTLLGQFTGCLPMVFKRNADHGVLERTVDAEYAWRETGRTWRSITTTKVTYHFNITYF